MDLIGYLRRIMNQTAAETFDPATDSLEAIANALGLGPSVGLGMFGIVDATQVASTITVITNNLQNIPNDVLEGQFWMQVIYNTSAPATAPEGEIRHITNFVQGGALQTFTVNAFTANVEAGDLVIIFHESLYEILTIRGGAETLESLDDELDAMLDLGDGDVRTLVMDGAEQVLYETTGSAFIYAFLGLWIDWTGLNFGAGEDTSIRFYLRADGVNYRLVSTEVFLAAALPVPVVTMHPRNANTDVVPAQQYFKQDLRITAQQAAIGGGWNTLTYNVIDAKRGT